MESNKRLIPVVLVALVTSLLISSAIFRSCSTSGMGSGSAQSAHTVAEESLAKMAGRYEIVAMVTEGKQTTPEDLELLKGKGLTCTITLEADGTGTLDLFGEQTSLTWDEKSISTAEKSMSYTYRDDQLIVADGDSSLTFSRAA